MKKSILSFCFCLLSLYAFSQEKDKAYFNKSRDIFGYIETFIIPEDSFFILQEDFTIFGMFGQSLDTLILNDGKLENKKFEISFLENGKILKSDKSSQKKYKPKKYKEFNICDSFINKNRNGYILRRMHYNTVDSVNKKIYNNQLFEHKSREYKAYLNKVKSTKCHKDFVKIADSIQHLKIELIDSIFETKELRYNFIIENINQLTADTLKSFLLGFDYSNIDEKAIVFIAENQPELLINIIAKLSDEEFRKLFIPSYIQKDTNTQIAKEKILAVQTNSYNARQVQKEIKKNW